MVGPSSSHTAGAVKIGYISGRLLGSLWCGQRSTCMAPFLRPGTDTVQKKALVAGLLGMQTDDIRIPQALEIAEERGIVVSFGQAILREAHPNTAQLIFTWRIRATSGDHRTVAGRQPDQYCTVGWH